MAKYTLFAKGGKVQGQKKLKDGNYASHKVSLEKDGKTKKYFVAYVNEGDDRTANFYDMAGKFVMDMKVSDGGKLVSEGKMKKVMDYEVPKENVKARDVSLKDMNYSELRQYIQDKYIDNLKDAEFYFNIYETGDSIEFVDESIRDQHKNIFEDNADYLEKDFEKKTGLKIDGFEILDDDGNELEEVTSGNTYNWGYLGGADFNYRVYKTSDGEKYYLMALIHMGGDIRGNYGDAFIFEGDSEDEVLMKFQGLLSGGGYIHFRFKDGSSVSFDSQQDSDVWYFEQHERNDEPVTGLAKQYLDDFESFGSWDGDGFLEATVEEFHQGKRVHSYDEGGESDYGLMKDFEKNFAAAYAAQQQSKDYEPTYITGSTPSEETGKKKWWQFKDGGLVKMSLDSLKNKLQKLDVDGEVFVDYDDESDTWAWEDSNERATKNFKRGFKTEKQAYIDIIQRVEKRKGSEFLTYEEIDGKKIRSWKCDVLNIDVGGGPVVWESQKYKYIFYAEPGFEDEKLLHIQVEREGQEEMKGDYNAIVFKSSNKKASFDIDSYLSEVKKIIDIIESVKPGELTPQDFKKDFVGARYEQY